MDVLVNTVSTIRCRSIAIIPLSVDTVDVHYRSGQHLNAASGGTEWEVDSRSDGPEGPRVYRPDTERPPVVVHHLLLNGDVKGHWDNDVTVRT